jgi:triosephosphate isomerase (TIM)
MSMNGVPVFAGNWKMHKSPAEARAFAREFLAGYPEREDRLVLFFPPAVSLASLAEAVRERRDVEVGAQNIHWEIQGAFTGEISAEMARDAGAGYTLVGHSERRHVFGERAEDTVRKVGAALRAGIVPILCVGETLQERRDGRAEETVAAQLAPVLDSIEDRPDRFLIAYEPVWAIGTGETASPRDAAEMHGFIRGRLRERFGGEASGVPILYGGSVKPANAGELLASADVDGVLVGGASLEAEDFAAICRAA